MVNNVFNVVNTKLCNVITNWVPTDVFNLLVIRGPTRGEGMTEIEPRSPDPQSTPIPLCHRGGHHRQVTMFVIFAKYTLMPYWKLVCDVSGSLFVWLDLSARSQAYTWMEFHIIIRKNELLNQGSDKTYQTASSSIYNTCTVKTRF